MTQLHSSPRHMLEWMREIRPQLPVGSSKHDTSSLLRPTERSWLPRHGTFDLRPNCRFFRGILYWLGAPVGGRNGLAHGI